MTILNAIAALSGAIAIYVGIRFTLTRKIPIVSEGGFEPLAWVEGRDAVMLGIFAICIGLVLLAASIGLIQFD